MTSIKGPDEAVTATHAERPPDVVHRAWYRDPSIFELERERLFRRVWHFACLTSDLPKPGDYYTVTVAGEPILVVRGKDQVLRAFLNACTHRGTALTEDGSGNHGNCGGAFQCMYHAWTFDTTGRLIGVPHDDAYGPNFDRSAHNLVAVKCETLGSFVFVALDPLRPTLREFLGGALEWMEPVVQDLEVIGRVSWLYDGNWKLWHENFRDNYHPPIVHKSVLYLNGATPQDAGSNHGLPPGHSLLRFPLKGMDFKRYDESFKEFTGIETDTERAMSKPPPSKSPRSGYYNIVAFFPNLDYQQPGASPASLQVVQPLAVDRTRVDIMFLAPASDEPEMRRYRLRNSARALGCWGEISVDDCELAERTTIGVQGLGTKYTNIARGTEPGDVGRTSDEYSLREFYSEYRRYLDLP